MLVGASSTTRIVFLWSLWSTSAILRCDGKLGDFVELDDRLLKFEVTNRLAQVIEMPWVDYTDNGFLQDLEGLLRVSIVSCQQRLQTTHRRSRACAIKGPASPVGWS